MVLTFYNAPNSTAIVTVAVIAELEHGESEPLFKRIDLDLKDGSTRTHEYLKNVNPNGHVPAIVHDGVAIWESAAITMYLGEMLGEAKVLYPAAGTSRGEAMKWIVWTNTTFGEAMRRLLATLKPEPDLSDERKAVKEEQASKAKADLGVCLGVLNGALEHREYLLQSGYTLADTHVWAFVSTLALLQLDLAPYEKVSAWKTKIEGRPAQAAHAAFKR